MLKKFLTRLANLRAVRFWNEPVPPFKAVCWQLGGCVGVLGAAALLVTVFDPCFRYRIPAFYPVTYRESPHKIPGLLRNGGAYDTLLLGASTAENARLSDLEAAFPGCRPMKAVATGASFYVQHRFFDLARRARGEGLKRVVQFVDVEILFLPPSYRPFELPDFLYEPGVWTDYGYWWNVDLWGIHGKHLLETVFRNRRTREFRERDRMFHKTYSERRYGLAAIMKRPDFLSACRLPEHYRENLETNVRRHLEAVARENPRIEFVYVLTPASLLYYLRHRKYGDLDAVLAARKLLFERLSPLANVRICDFQYQPGVIDNFDLYRDVYHYRDDILQKTFRALAGKQFDATSPAQVEAHSRALREMTEKALPRFAGH